MKKEKKELRKIFLQVRDSIDKDVRLDMSLEICDRIAKTDAYINASAVFVYVSIGSEVDTYKLIDRVLKDGKRLIVPKCNTKERLMVLYEIKDLKWLKVGAYNIPEPSDEAIQGRHAFRVDSRSIDLAVVPALAFDETGRRLGYGGGYYDKFLSGFCGYSVGIAYPQCMADELPHEDFDCRVDEVICAKGMK